MIVVNKISELREALKSLDADNKVVGLVPTMGALHQGHAALIRQSVKENEIAVVSIFVNPTQFNNKEDLRLYPKTPQADLDLLREIGVDIAFMPEVEEMYPEPDTREFDFGNLDKVMEGKYRPGHFNGVAQIVSKLFTFVEPNRAYFGEKDFQQLAIIRQMVKQLSLPIEIVGVPIVREDSGLAMSSRNERLSSKERKTAANIYKILCDSKNLYPQTKPSEIINQVVDTINKIDGLSVEYFEIADGNTLQSVSEWSDSEYVVGCITVFCGKVRLIDNIKYK